MASSSKVTLEDTNGLNGDHDSGAESLPMPEEDPVDVGITALEVWYVE